MILILRGHIRNSFKTLDLYNLIKNIYELDSNLKIFIHTWNVFANNISWRNITLDKNRVTKEIIYDYFKNFKYCIKDIIIDNDREIELIGNLRGNICKTKMKTIGWKNYWYGKYKIIKNIYDKKEYENEMVVNTRFDLLNNSFSFSNEQVINFIKNNIEKKFTKNKFIFDYEYCGIDNIYIGNIETMYILSYRFFYFLDLIIYNHKNVSNQEFLVFKVNNILFRN
jgi:hypothetical protein